MIHGAFCIRDLIKISYPLFLTITLLLPLLLSNKTTGNKQHSITDKLIVFYIITISILSFRDTTTSHAIRTCITIALDIYVPYFAISRYIQTADQLKTALTALFIGLLPLTLIGFFEAIKHWHLFDQLAYAMANDPHQKKYDERAGLTRASTVFFGPIIYGYVMVIGNGLALYLRPLMEEKFFRLSFLLFSFALIASVARGPWVGLAVLIIAYVLTGKAAISQLFKLGLSGLAIFALLSLSTFGNKLLDLLPFIGTAQSGTVDYREQLIENALIVIQRNPWFGSTTFLETPEMESMRQGEGIIDLVNTYIQIALAYGSIGLILFLAIFIGLLIRCYRIIKRLPSEEVDLIRMGRALFAILTAILFIIFTTSSINYVPVFYWIFTGITAAYLNIAKQTIKKH
ncbi:MAG: O-antigen ligase family protein [Endozoicomonadaceae bacterium]|nr:O-antigen ligase family protein [Endozoicomonadaceae bacterium]